MKKQTINNGLNNCPTKEYITHSLYYVIEKYFKNLISSKHNNFIQKYKSKLKIYTSFKSRYPKSN